MSGTVNDGVNHVVYERIRKEGRVSAIVDCIIINFKENSVNFEEEKVRALLKQVEDEKALMVISAISALIEGVNGCAE